MYRALGLAFDVEAPVPALRDYVDDLLADVRSRRRSTFTYELRRASAGETVLFGAEQPLGRFADDGRAVDALLGDLNLRAIEASRDLLLLHAGGCARGEDAVVLCGPSGSGKTTLTAALVAGGLQYLTDETVAVRPDALTIAPWPKPLTVKRGSWGVLPHLEPAPDSPAARHTADVWHVPSARIRPGAVAGASTSPRAVVLPTYRAGAGVRLEPVSRAEAAMTLFEQTSYGADHGPGVVDLLRRLLAPCSTHRLVFDDLDGAVEAIAGLLP